MAKDLLEVKCPDCRNILLVNPKTGEVVEVRRPILENSTGDRFEDARQKVREQSDRAAKAFEEARRKEKEKLDRLNAFFKEKKEELKDQPVERPDHLFDRD